MRGLFLLLITRKDKNFINTATILSEYYNSQMRIDADFQVRLFRECLYSNRKRDRHKNGDLLVLRI